MAKRGIAIAAAIIVAALLLALPGAARVQARQIQHGCYGNIGDGLPRWIDSEFNDPNNIYHDRLCGAHTPDPNAPTVTATGTSTATPTPTATRRPTRRPIIRQPSTRTPTPTATPPTTGSSAPSLPVPVLNAEAIEGGVALSWNAVPGATRYELWTWTEPGGWQQLGGNNLAASSYDHTMLMAGTVYYYAIRAEDSGGHVSGWSPYLAAAVPAAPASGTALAVPMLIAAPAEGRVEISWSTVTGAVRYELWAWWDAETGWRQLGDVNLTGNAYTHSGLTPDTTYWYVVRAVDAAGATSAWSEHIPATVPAS